MSKHGRIIRPRQLFPEYYALWIQLRRGMLRLFWWFGGIDLWMPPWATAAATGTLAIMFAILLFFLRGPAVSASPVATNHAPVIPQETIKFIHVPVPTPAVELTLPSLQTKIVRTKLDELWDQYETATITSKADSQNQPWRNLLPREGDPWKIALPCRENAEEFTSYLLRGAQVPFAPNVVTTSNVPQPIVAARGRRVTGLFVEKLLPASAANRNVPYSYDIIIRNPTQQAIDGVVVRELMSDLERVISVAPVAAVQGNELVWSLGMVPPGTDRKLTVTVVPQNDLSIETQVTLTAVSQFASSSTIVKSPIVPMALDIYQSAEPLEPAPQVPEPVFEPEPEPVPVVTPEPKPESVPGKPILKLTATPVSALESGDNLQVVFTVTNVGTAAADNVDIYVLLSDHFKHRYGKHVKHSISRLNPGDAHQAVLRASAMKVGTAFFNASLTMAGEEQEQREVPLTITAAKKMPTAPAPAQLCRPTITYRPAPPIEREQIPMGQLGFYGQPPLEVDPRAMIAHWPDFEFFY